MSVLRNEKRLKRRDFLFQMWKRLWNYELRSVSIFSEYASYSFWIRLLLRSNTWQISYIYHHGKKRLYLDKRKRKGEVVPWAITGPWVECVPWRRWVRPATSKISKNSLHFRKAMLQMYCICLHQWTPVWLPQWLKIEIGPLTKELVYLCSKS